VQQFIADSTHLINTTKFYAKAPDTFPHLKLLDYSHIFGVDATA